MIRATIDPFRHDPDHFVKRLGYGEFKLEEYPGQTTALGFFPSHTTIRIMVDEVMYSHKVVRSPIAEDYPEIWDRQIRYAKWDVLRAVASAEIGLDEEEEDNSR